MPVRSSALPFTGLFPWGPGFPLCFGTGQIGGSSMYPSDDSKSRIVRCRQKSRIEAGHDFSYLRWRCVLRVSLEVALSEQSTHQIRQSNICKRRSRWRQVSFRSVDFFVPQKLCPRGGPNLPVSGDMRLEAQKNMLRGGKLIYAIRVLCELGDVCMYVLIAAVPDLVCDSCQITLHSNARSTAKTNGGRRRRRRRRLSRTFW